MKKIDKNQAELGIKLMITMFQRTIFLVLLLNLLKKFIRFWELGKTRKKRGRHSYPQCSILKLLVYAKVDHIESARVIEEMVKFHDMIIS